MQLEQCSQPGEKLKRFGTFKEFAEDLKILWKNLEADELFEFFELFGPLEKL